MITKTEAGYEFMINGVSGKLNCGKEYSLSFQEQTTSFPNLKMLHLYVNSLTDIVESIDSSIGV